LNFGSSKNVCSKRLFLGGLSRVHAPHLPLSGGESVVIELLTMIVVMIPLLWTAVEHFSTMTHEGAHALVAVILGLTVTEIVLNRHSEGKTGIVGDGLRAVLVVLIGYLVWLAGTGLALIVGGKLLVLG
jgi:hypothetical protein